MTRHRNPYLVTDYRQDLRLLRSRPAQMAAVGLLLVYLALPLQLDDVWLGVFNRAAMFAIGAIGLNLLTGYTGQVSLGHAFFMACGSFTAAFLGKSGWPMLGWLVAAAVIGGLLGALIGPVALRLHGNYLAIVTLGLLFLGQHIFTQWKSVTGGGRGTAVDASFTVGPVDFKNLTVFGQSYSEKQGLFWLLWLTVAVAALLAKNIVRSRPGRAMQAVRDRDIAAEVIGISLVRYKLGAFAVSSGLAAVAGAFSGAAIQGFVNPDEFGGTLGLILSIQFVAVIIIGGMGTIFGSILGALLVGGLPLVIEHFSASLPFLKQGPGAEGLMTVASFNNALFGVLVIVFLLAEPLGIAGVWLRVKTYCKLWPFSY